MARASRKVAARTGKTEVLDMKREKQKGLQKIEPPLSQAAPPTKGEHPCGL
jgi:hypothetical protein